MDGLSQPHFDQTAITTYNGPIGQFLPLDMTPKGLYSVVEAVRLYASTNRFDSPPTRSLQEVPFAHNA